MGVGKSAKALSIEWPGSYCNGVKLSPHYMKVIGKAVNGGFVFQCVKCHAHKWLPSYLSEQIVLGTLMRKHGGTEGYQMMLDMRPKAKVMMAKLHDLEHIRKVVKDDKAFVQLVGVLMGSQEYDKEEEDEL